MYSPDPTIAESRRRCGNSSSTIGVFSTQLYRQPAGKANCLNTMRSKASLAYTWVLNQPNLVERFGRLVCVLETMVRGRQSQGVGGRGKPPLRLPGPEALGGVLFDQQRLLPGH